MENGKMDFGPTLQNKFGEYYLPAINQEVFSQSGSDSFYRRYYDQSLQTKDSLYLIVGTDSGLLVNWVITCGLADGSRYLFIEYPELVEQLQRTADLPQEWPENVRICTHDDWLVHAEEFSIKEYCYLGTVRRIKSLAVVDAFFEDYLRIWNNFEEKIGQYQLSVGQDLGSHVFMVKGLENLAENRISATCLVGLFTGKTAILLAGGPSLRESYTWVKANRADLVVLAVSRIAPQLQQEGIIPDFFFAIDPHDIIFHQSKGMLAFWQDTLLVNVYHLNPRLLSQWRGRHLYMGSLFPWKTELNTPHPAADGSVLRNPTLAFPGITVGHQALGMAIEMGFSQIILSGLDLCFDQQGFTHTEGSEERKVGPFTAPSELWVETNGGWKAETRYDFLNAIPSLEVLAKFAVQRGCRVVNPAKGAVRIANVDHAPWESLVVSPLPEPAKSLIQAAVPAESRSSRVQHYERVTHELLRVRDEVQKIVRLTTEAVECNDRLFGRKGKPPDFKFKKRMDEIEELLDTEHLAMSHLVKRSGVGEFLKLSRPDQQREWTDEEIETTGRRYYEIYRDSAGALTRLLDETRQRLRARQEEELAQPGIKKLLAQWQKDATPGRLWVFLDRRQQRIADFPDKTAVALQAMATEFQQLLDETETNYKAHCLQSLATPQAVRFKMLHLFKQKDRERLRAFASGLEQTIVAPAESVGEAASKSVTDGKEQYGLFIAGLLAELEGDLAGGAHCYRQIVSPFLLADATLRLLAIALTQGDLFFALPIAKRLAERLPIHTPYYGDLLRLTGQREEAVAVWEEYVKKTKNDVVTMLKLGKLHRELGQLEEARRVFARIVQEDPHNKAAALFLQELAQTEPTAGAA